MPKRGKQYKPSLAKYRADLMALARRLRHVRCRDEFMCVYVGHGEYSSRPRLQAALRADGVALAGTGFRINGSGWYTDDNKRRLKWVRKELCKLKGYKRA